jgi:hypothetical protein
MWVGAVAGSTRIAPISAAPEEVSRLLTAVSATADIAVLTAVSSPALGTSAMSSPIIQTGAHEAIRWHAALRRGPARNSPARRLHAEIL